ncbi:hypothetical protein J6590_080488 [Homalodisca vitripennis]|nr:hypothetical protein J6590_080488 [Homalodisca vitripennis]
MRVSYLVTGRLAETDWQDVSKQRQTGKMSPSRNRLLRCLQAETDWQDVSKQRQTGKMSPSIADLINKLHR